MTAIDDEEIIQERRNIDTAKYMKDVDFLKYTQIECNER